MQKILLVIYILVGINLYGANKAKCEELFRSAIHNFYLENSCKFDKHVSTAIRKVFEEQDCTRLFTDDDMKRLNNEVLGDSYQKMSKIGRDEFCKSNKVKYDELGKRYLQNGH